MLFSKFQDVCLENLVTTGNGLASNGQNLLNNATVPININIIHKYYININFLSNFLSTFLIIHNTT